MSDQNFLAHFIEEPLYVIKEDSSPIPDTSVAEPIEAKGETKPEETTNSAEPAIADAPVTVKEPAAPVYVKPLPTAGNNLKHCIILVDSPEELLEEPFKVLLYKIIGAVKRNPEDILLANCRDAGKDQIEALLANNNHKHLLAFGTDVLTELTGIQPYTIHKPEYVAMLKADSLSEIASDVDKKKALWKALQVMFTLS